MKYVVRTEYLWRFGHTDSERNQAPQNSRVGFSKLFDSIARLYALQMAAGQHSHPPMLHLNIVILGGLATAMSLETNAKTAIHMVPFWDPWSRHCGSRISSQPTNSSPRSGYRQVVDPCKFGEWAISLIFPGIVAAVSLIVDNSLGYYEYVAFR